MAFDKNTLANIGGTSPAPIIYSYVTQDTKATILAIGYFNAAFTTFTVDDIVKVVNNEGTFDVRVIAVGRSNIVVQLIIVDERLSTTAFDEVRATQDTPITQISATYGLLGQVLTVTDTAASGSNTVVDDKFTCQTGLSVTGLASILTLRQIGSRPGQGTISRIDCVFDTPIADSQQACGLITSENSYVFAFLGTAFGIAHAHGGVSEEQELTITTEAGGAETATINIDGNAFSVPLTAGTVQHNALEIANSLEAQVVNYNFTSNNDQVVAQSLLSGPQGAFSFSSATAAGSWIQNHAGVSAIIDFTPQSAWSEDTRISTDTNINLDPTKGNLYQIQVNSNFGQVRFSIEDRETGAFVLVHRLKLGNASITPNVTNPTFRLGWLVQSLGSTSNLTISGNSCGAFIEGKSRRNNFPRSVSNNQIGVVTALTNIVTVRSRIHFGGKVNRVESFLNLLSVSSQANKSTFFKIIIDPVFGGDVDFSYLDKDNSVLEVATDLVGVSGGTEIDSFTIAANGSDSFRFSQTDNQEAFILPGTVFTIAAFAASGAGGDMQAALTIQEDII